MVKVVGVRQRPAGMVSGGSRKTPDPFEPERSAVTGIVSPFNVGLPPRTHCARPVVMVVQMRIRPRHLLRPDVLAVLRLQAPHLQLQRLHHTRLRLLLLAPVEHELLALEGGQQFTAHLLDLGLLGLGQHEFGFGQDVEQRQLFFDESFGDAALLLGCQRTGEILQLGEEGLDVLAAGVVGVDQFLEPLGQIDACAVEFQHLGQPAFDQAFQLLGLGAFVSLGELRLQRREVDLRQIDQRRRVAGRADPVALGGDRIVEQRFDIAHDAGDIRRIGLGADLVGEVRHQHRQRRQLVCLRVGQDRPEQPRHPPGELQKSLLVGLGGEKSFDSIIDQPDAREPLRRRDGVQPHAPRLGKACRFIQRRSQCRHQLGLVEDG